MTLGGFLESLGGRWRMEDRIGDLALALPRKTNDFGLLDGPAGGSFGLFLHTLTSWDFVV
jgi:hypothetical protein